MDFAQQRHSDALHTAALLHCTTLSLPTTNSFQVLTQPQRRRQSDSVVFVVGNGCCCIMLTVCSQNPVQGSRKTH